MCAPDQNGIIDAPTRRVARSLAAYNDHLARFPNCVFSTLAAARIEALIGNLRVDK